VGGEPTALRRKSNIVRRLANAQSRAAGVSPPWSVNRPLCHDNRTLSGGWRMHNQERRASARRGCCWGNVVRNVLERTCKCVCETTGGLRPPLLVQSERLPVKKRFSRCRNAHSQERRASARRGSVNRPRCGENRNIVRRLANAQPRAAGVSPPWRTSRGKYCKRRSSLISAP
jgi:hypothetical protein